MYYIFKSSKLSPKNVIADFKKIPGDTTVFDLGHFQLGCLASDEFIEAFKRLPPIKSLLLKSSSIGRATVSEKNKIITALENMPPSIINLDLGSNELWTIAPFKLKTFFLRAINLSTLDLSNNNLGNDSKYEFVKLIEILPQTITALNLSNNNLEKIPFETLVKAIKKIPKLVTTLDLSNNNFGYWSEEQFEAFFIALPEEIRTLKLGCLSFTKNHNDKGNVLERVLSKISKSITHLDFQRSALGTYLGTELAQAFSVIPKNITHLNLQLNAFHTMNHDDFLLALQNLPPTLHQLDLSNNFFNRISDVKMAEIFKAIPSNIEVTFGDDQNQMQKSYVEFVEQIKATNANLETTRNSIDILLTNYLDERAKVTHAGKIKEFYYGSFFSVFQKSYTAKKDAVEALRAVLGGFSVDLSKHISTLRNGALGAKLREFVKSGQADILVGKQVTTVSGFVKALQDNIPTPLSKPK